MVGVHWAPKRSKASGCSLTWARAGMKLWVMKVVTFGSG